MFNVLLQPPSSLWSCIPHLRSGPAAPIFALVLQPSSSLWPTCCCPHQALSSLLSFKTQLLPRLSPTSLIHCSDRFFLRPHLSLTPHFLLSAPQRRLSHLSVIAAAPGMQTEAMATEVASTIKLTTMPLAQLLAPGIAKINVLNPVPEETLVHSRCAHLHTDMKNKCVCE